MAAALSLPPRGSEVDPSDDPRVIRRATLEIAMRELDARRRLLDDLERALGEVLQAVIDARADVGWWLRAVEFGARECAKDWSEHVL